MALQNEELVVGDGLAKELPNDMSRSTQTLVSGAGNLPLFRVLGRITASGKLTSYDPTASNGAQTAVAVLIAPTDATSADAKAPVIDWTALFAVNRLNYGAGVTTAAHRTSAILQLGARGIKVLNQA